MKHIKIITAITLLISIPLTLIIQQRDTRSTTNGHPAPAFKSSHSPKASPSSVAGRETYFFNLLRDPVQNKIPKSIRLKELERYNSLMQTQLKSSYVSSYTWTEIGPTDVGGRTRALAIDVRNSNVIFAGGVSGGIWKSTDKGQTWILKNSPAESFAVTSICQDPREGYQNTWYYACGEYTGNSASAPTGTYYGHGLYKSTDNGDTWLAILGTNTSPYIWDNITDYVSKIQVDPLNGSLIIAAHGYGLLLTFETEGTYNLYSLIGGNNDHYFCDFDIDAEGNILVVLSEFGYNKYFANPPIDPANNPGVYYAAKETYSFTQIHPSSATFPETHQRSLVRFAPSDPNIGYVFTTIDEAEVAFHKIDINANTLIERTANLPDFSGTNGKLGIQGNYNMTLAVKPNDPNFVIIGSTSLFRSNNGFSGSQGIDYTWIGGYLPDGTITQYDNHHPDCHITLFDPAAPDAVWSGHDGGLSFVSDITQTTTTTQFMPWIDMNHGYNVTQFYTLADPVKANDTRYMGGTQDNGTPYFRWNSPTGESQDISSGDGAHCYFGKNYSYVSIQNGLVGRLGYDEEGNPRNPFSPIGPYDWSIIHPSDAEGQLFINPFIINPNNETVMYYAGGNQLWINQAIESLPNYIPEGTTQDWYAPDALAVPGYTITALTVSKAPGDVLYYGAYSSADQPKIFKVENSTAEPDDLLRSDISIPAAIPGSYPCYITVNPFDANEIIIIFSNYGVPSIFHSTDGGANYTQVDGNLLATAEMPGPSIRSAAIHNWDGGKQYFISTSIGVYETSSLNGNSTIWQNVATNQLGNVVCNRVKTSMYDGKVITATHGRGIFVGNSDNPVFINKTLPNLKRTTTSPDEIINVAAVFGHSSGLPIAVNIHSNTNPAVVTHNLAANVLTLDFSNTNTGTSIITLRGTNASSITDMAFAVSVEDESTDMEDIGIETNKRFSLYPNPNNGRFQVSVQNNLSIKGEAAIFNSNGQTILTKTFNNQHELNNYIFDISDQNTGIYIFSLTYDNQKLKQKFIKQ